MRGALSNTAPGGEINCLDAGDFAPVTITQAVTIDCDGTFGSIGVSTGIGVTISAGAGDVVTLRNLSIKGTFGGGSGIDYLAAQALHAENVSISNLPVCLNALTSAASLITVDNATISDCNVYGISVGTTSGTAVVNVNNTRITNTGIAVRADNGSRVTVRNSTIYFNNFGVSQGNLLGSTLGSTVTVVNSTLGFSNTAALQSLSGDFILAFGNTFVNDVPVYSPNGGSIFTGSDNNNSGSTTGTANGGSVPKV